MVVAATQPLMSLSVYGMGRQATLLTGPAQLGQRNMLPLALVVLVTTLVAPLTRLLLLAWVLAGLRLKSPPRHLTVLFSWVEWLRPWAMIEVFLLGLFVAYTKLVDLASVQVGIAGYALGALMLITAAVDASLDPQAVWDALPRRRELPHNVPAGRALAATPLSGHRTIGCRTCHLVTTDQPLCPRCGSRLRARKRDSLTRTWALLLAATALYLPANLLPVLTFVKLGQGQPSTILEGVEELAAAQMWPLALLVFFASITVPVMKILSLGLMLITVHTGSRWRLRERTRLYRIVEFIGRWSMIDVFMISILTALVRLGFVASVYPGRGVTAFCAVVILTMLASACFDPRLMWDAARRPGGE
jgi:paraquat-inducible protein A